MKKFTAKLLVVLAVLVVGLALVFFVRKAQATAQVEREWQAAPAPVSNLGATSRLEILPLYEEASEDSRLTSGHGVSYLIRTDALTVLLDVGNNRDKSDPTPFLQNMQALGIAEEEIDAVVISHPHPDHLGGLNAWQKRTILLGDGNWNVRPIYVPAALSVEGANIVPSDEPTVVGPGIATTGVISYPDVFPLSVVEPKGKEQGLVINVTGQGLVLITGCGHPTIERLVERAEALFGQPVVGVMGGLHYEGLSAEEVQPHIQFLAERQPKLVALSPHDNSPQAIEAFQTAFPEAYQYVRVGQIISFP